MIKQLKTLVLAIGLVAGLGLASTSFAAKPKEAAPAAAPAAAAPAAPAAAPAAEAAPAAAPAPVAAPVANATPVLMIQGLGADKHGWDMQRFALALHYRVIALDNRGAGRSDKPFGHYTLEQMADDAIALESGRLVLHKAAGELLADPNIERLFLGGAHTTSAAATTITKNAMICPLRSRV